MKRMAHSQTMYERILGIDEAGRGCVIGPLVIAALMMDEEKLVALRELGVKDSKCLRPTARKRLLEPIRKLSFQIKIIEIAPEDIDRAVRQRGLDRLEARACAELLREMRPRTAFIDAPGPGGRAFERHIRERLGATNSELICENGADARYPVVSAASILAKECREDRIHELRLQYGDFGSGYPSDPKTRSFLKKILTKKKKVPDYIRSEWATIRKLRDEDIPLFAGQPP